MLELADSLLNSSSSVSCWTCGVFDRLFAIISNCAAAAYDRLMFFCVIIFCILFSFYIFSAFWKNISGGVKDPFLQKSVKPVLIKSLIALSLLTFGLGVPKFISKITFEPVATVTLEYAKAMLPSETSLTSNYTPVSLDDSGFFSPKLRDTLLQLIQTSLVNFQMYVRMGLKIIDQAFSLWALTNVAALLKHTIVLFIGLILTYNFIKLFIKYSFCFLDVIVAMAMFAFFFPISLVLFIFKDAQDLPGWMKNLGGNLGSGQIKKLINAIVSIGSTILTYTIIMMIISGYFTSNGLDPNSMSTDFSSLFDLDLNHSDAMQLSFLGAIVLVYVIKYIADQVPEITKKIMSVFGVSQEDSLSKEAGEDLLKLTKIVKDKTVQVAKEVINSGTKSGTASGGGSGAASGAGAAPTTK